MTINYYIIPYIIVTIYGLFTITLHLIDKKKKKDVDTNND